MKIPKLAVTLNRRSILLDLSTIQFLVTNIWIRQDFPSLVLRDLNAGATNSNGTVCSYKVVGFISFIRHPCTEQLTIISGPGNISISTKVGKWSEY